MLTGRSITHHAARWFQPIIIRQQFSAAGLSLPELELVIRQGLVGCRWVLLQNGETIWAGRHGWLGLLAEVLSAVAGLPAWSVSHVWQDQGRALRSQVWPGIGVAQIVEVPEAVAGRG